MKGLAVLLLVLSLCVALSSAGRREQVVLTAASSSNTTLSAGKLQSFVGNCDDAGYCPPLVFFVNIPEVLFRPNVRDIGLRMRLVNVTCHREGQLTACPNYTKSTGMRLLMTNSQGVQVQGANFTAWEIGELTKEHTAQGLKQKQVYTINIHAPVNSDDDTLVYQFSGQVEAIYSTDAPAWVIAVLVLGGILVVFLLCAIFYCLWKRFSSNQNGYESFD